LVVVAPSIDNSLCIEGSIAVRSVRTWRKK
jgi:hypothetical protein